MEKTCLVGLIASLISVSISTAAVAETPADKGLRIMKEAHNADAGYGDLSATMVMTLTNRAGNTRKRAMRTKTLEGKNGASDKSLSFFDQPADVKGTKLLTFSNGLKPNNQWLFLPALKHVKRINSRHKSGSFMGSEFAFEDLGSQRIEKYTYTYLRQEACGEGSAWTCHVIERIPAYKFSGYTKQLVWLDAENYRIAKVTYYDRKKTFLKTLTATGYRQYLGKHWRPGKMSMINHQSGKGTILDWSNYQFKTGLKARDFNSKSLAR